MLEDISDEWMESALCTTGHFEDAGEPLAAVSGDYDNMGVSLGVLQWNIGSGSLQPLIKKSGRASIVDLMPHYGVDLWTACTSTIPTGLAIVRSWQNEKRLRPEVLAELKSLVRSATFLSQQKAHCARVANSALIDARAYAADDPSYSKVTKALFCWFFDVETQDGGLKGLSYTDVAGFIRMQGTSKARTAVCDWLASRGSGQLGYKDSRRNAEIWRIDDERLSLLVLSYLRALKSKPRAQAEILNRKGTIAIGTGWANGEKHDLKALIA